MEKITRRLFLRHSAAAGAVAATVAAPVVAGAASVSDLDRVKATVSELRCAMDAYMAGRTGSWNVYMIGNRPGGKRDIVIVTADSGRTNIFNPQDSASKVHVHINDGSPLLADDVTGTTAYADWEKQRAKS